MANQIQNPISTFNGLRRHTPIAIARDLIHHQVLEQKSPALKSSLEAHTMEETSATSITLYTFPISNLLHQGCFIMRPRKAYLGILLAGLRICVLNAKSLHGTGFVPLCDQWAEIILMTWRKTAGWGQPSLTSVAKTPPTSAWKNERILICISFYLWEARKTKKS